MSTYDLGPCPFCASRKVRMADADEDACFVFCPDCFTTGPVGTWAALAAEKWNTAAPTDANTRPRAEAPQPQSKTRLALSGNA